MTGGRASVKYDITIVCVKRKLTGVVDAFLREACDRIETHNQYEVIQKYHVRRNVRRKGGMPSKCDFELQALLAFSSDTRRS